MDLANGINGLFKGGGAKGVVYAGALKAVEERGITFAAVAGSSAGAITATLVAARMPSDALAESTVEALKAVRLRLLGGFLPWAGKSLFSVDRLEAWLEEVLKERMIKMTGGHPNRPVTFKQLFEASGIELNVVAMDLSRKQPVVFNHLAAPECQVARAVVASCAIPLAMPAGRVVIRAQPDGPERIHRIVDGGAWANYPAFVFRDPSFREFHGLPEMASTRPTIGFVINDPSSGDRSEPDIPIRLERRRRSRDDLGSGTASGVVGALFNWSVMRFAAFVLLPLGLGFITLAWLRSQLSSFFPVVRVLPNSIEPFAVVSLVFLLVVVLSVAVALAISVLRIGRELFDVGLPSALAALSVGPGVPDWVGSSETDPVVRLSAPEGITTTRFKINDEVREKAIKRAHREAASQLDRLRLLGPSSPAQEKVSAPESPERVPGTTVPREEVEAAIEALKRAGRWQLPANQPGRRFWLGVGLFLGFGGGATLALNVARNILSGRAVPAIGLGLMMAFGTLGTMAYAARVREQRVKEPPIPQARKRSWIRATVVAVLFGGLTFLLFTVQVGSPSRFGRARRVDATITRIGETRTKRIYDVQLDRPLPEVTSGSFTGYCGSPARSSCLRFESGLSTLKAGDRTEVLYLPERKEAFLSGEEWANDDLSTAAFNVGVWLALAVLLAWAVEDLRRSRRAALPG